MAMKRTASDILAEQHWKRRLLTNELTTTSGYEAVPRVNGTGYTNNSCNNVMESAVRKKCEIPSVQTEPVQCTSDAQPYDVEFPITQYKGGVMPVTDYAECHQVENGSVIEHGENYNISHENNHSESTPVSQLQVSMPKPNDAALDRGADPIFETVTALQRDKESTPVSQLQVSMPKPNDAALDRGAGPIFETITALQRDKEQNSEMQVVIPQVEQIPADTQLQDTCTLSTTAIANQENSHGQCGQSVNDRSESCTNAESLPASFGEQNQPDNEVAPQCKAEDLNSSEQQLEHNVPPQEPVNAQNAEIQDTHISVDYSQDCSQQSGGHGNGHVETRHIDGSESTVTTITGSQCDTGHESHTNYSVMHSGNIIAVCDDNTPAPVSNEEDSPELLQTKASEIYSTAGLNEHFQNGPHENMQQPKHMYQALEATSSGEQYKYSQSNQVQGPSGICPAIQPTVTYETLGPMQTPPQTANSKHVHTPGHSATAINFYGVEQHSAMSSLSQGSGSTVSGYTESGPANPPALQQDMCSSMNYQPYIVQEQGVSSNEGNDRAYDQPHPGCLPLPTTHTQFYPAAAHHYQGAAIPRPNSSSDHGYLKNEASYPPEQKMPQTQQLQEGLNNCIPNFLNSKDYVHDGSPSTSCQRQLPELMLHQSYLTGTEASKENFDAGPHKANYHSRQALTPMNVPPQFWSAPHHGTPICSARSYGPPRHYRPAPYTFPVCSCAPSPMNMHSCRSCHVGHNQMTPRSRHPRSFNSSYTEYSCREEHKVHPRRSLSCCHIGQHMPNDGSVYADDPNYVMTPGMQALTPKTRAKQMGDFSAEGARFHNASFRSNSWHSFSSDMSSDSDSPMITSRAQPGLEGSIDYEALMERQMAPNSLSNPNNPVLRNLPPPGLERTKFLVSTYIDYLTEENESITDMSKAFTPPTYLFLEEEQYVLQAHKNESPFPSNRFSKWIKQYFPQVDAISVPEGKSNGNTTNISKLNLSDKSFDEFAHIVFFGCQDMQEKRKVVPVQAPVPTPAPILAQPVAGN